MFHTLRSSLSKWAAAAAIALAGPVMALTPAENSEEKKPVVVTRTPAKATKKSASPKKPAKQTKQAPGKPARSKSTPKLAPSSAKPKPASVRLGTAAKSKSAAKKEAAAKKGAAARKLSAGNTKKAAKPAGKPAKSKAGKAEPAGKKPTLKPTTLHSGKVDLPKPRSVLRTAEQEDKEVPFNVPPSTQPSVNTLELPEAPRI